MVVLHKTQKQEPLTIYDDPRKAHSTLNEHSFVYKTINYSENFMDLSTIYSRHSLTIKCLWRLIKRDNIA